MQRFNGSSLLFVALSAVLFPVSFAIDCFKCVSVNGNNPSCEDPFHNNHSSELLQTPCWAGRKNRDGVFPATACVKLNGIFVDSSETMFIRDCALDSGSLTTDTELVRMSHCGAFYFDNRYVKGCVQSCFEDACNHSLSIQRHSFVKVIISLFVLTRCLYI